MSIKYIGVPTTGKKNHEDRFRYYGGKDNPNIRKLYIDQLDALPYLKRIDIGTEELVVYENENYAPYFRAVPSLLEYERLENLEEKYTFTSSTLNQDFDFIERNNALQLPTISTRRLFENISPENIFPDKMLQSVNRVSGETALYARAPEGSVSTDGSHVVLTAEEKTENYAKIPIPKDSETVTIEYRDPAHDFSNHIENPSFENGLWKEKVGDCNNFDQNGLLDMRHSSEASDGSHSLELHATRHIACTNQKIPVSGGKTYLFSFDYQSPNAKNAGYYIGFDTSEKSSISEKIPIKKGDAEWHTFIKQITIPDGATNAALHVYSYSTDNKTEIITRYDNFYLIELPDILDRYYLVSDPQTNFVEPREIGFDLLNPTKKLVHVKGATTPFYLAMSESYHPQWQAQLNNEKINGFFKRWIPWVKPDRISDDKHFELDGFLNGWFVEPEVLCADGNTACTKNPDGSYDMEMTVEFFPQRWFYLGLLISGTTLVGCVAYLAYDFTKRRRNRKRKESLPTIPATNMSDYPRTEPVATDSPKPAPPTSLHTPQVVIKRPPRRKV